MFERGLGNCDQYSLIGVICPALELSAALEWADLSALCSRSHSSKAKAPTSRPTPKAPPRRCITVIIL